MSPKKEELLPHLGTSGFCYAVGSVFGGLGGVSDSQDRRGEQSKITAPPGGSESHFEPKLACSFPDPLWACCRLPGWLMSL